MIIFIYTLSAVCPFCQFLIKAQDTGNSKIEKHVDQIVLPFVETNNFNGAIGVSENGKITLAKVYGKMSIEYDLDNEANTNFYLASVAMMFTSIAIRKLADQGRLRIIKNIFLFILCLMAFIACSSLTERETVLDRRISIFKELEDVPHVDRRDKGYDFEFIQIDDSVSIYCLQKGEGIPIVLLNGGPGNSCHSFIPYFDWATKFSRLIIYDPRGVGKSDWYRGTGYSTQQLIGDLEKLRMKLNIEKWVVAGWSYGGLAAQHYTLKYPKRVLGLVLINSAYSANYDFDDETYPDYLSNQEREKIREIYSINGSRVVPVHSDNVELKDLQKMIFNGYLNGDWKRQFFIKPTKDEMAAVALYEWIHDKNYNQLVRKDGYAINLSGRFKEFNKPVLIYYGKYDMSFSSDLPEKMKKEFPNSRLVIMEKSSHNPFKEQPVKFFEELELYINQIHP